MAKICKACGGQVVDQAVVCQYCGGREFAPVEENRTTVPASEMNPVNEQHQQAPQYQQNPQYQQAPQYQQNPQGGWQPPPAPVKKNKTGIVVAIVAIVVVLVGLGVIGSFAEKVFQEMGYGYYEDDNNLLFNSSSYTKGTFDGAVYTNEWADIKLIMPDDYVDADSASYAESEDEVTECGLYLFSEDSTKLMYISFEKLPTFPEYTEEEYLEIALEYYEDSDDDEITTEVLWDECFKTVSLAGKDYLSAKIVLNNGLFDIVQDVFVRKHDGYMIFISTMDSEFSANLSTTATQDLKDAISTIN